MFVHMYVCMYVCMYVFMFLLMFVCMLMYVCMYLYMYVCYLYVSLSLLKSSVYNFRFVRFLILFRQFNNYLRIAPYISLKLLEIAEMKTISR